MSRCARERSGTAQALLAAALVAALAAAWPALPSRAAPNNSVSLRSSADLTPDYTRPGATNLTILTFTLRDDALNEYFTEARVDYTGTSITDLAALHLFCESERSGGSFDPSEDDLLATNASPTSSPILLTLSFKMPFHLDQQFYLVAELNESAAHRNRVDLRVLKNDLIIDGRTCPSTSVDPAGEALIDALPPGGWASFSPDNWQYLTSPDCLVSALDNTSGLNVSSAAYHYSTDRGASWSEWLSAGCSGANGTTQRQTIAARGVPFGRASASDNQIQFRVSDVVGQFDTSPVYTVLIDDTPPGGWRLEAPVGWYTAHQRPTVVVSAHDDLSGLNLSSAGAEYSRDGGASWLPILNLSASQGRAGAGPGAVNISAHGVPFDSDTGTRNLIRFNISDLAGNVNSSGALLIKIDTQAPAAPSLEPEPTFTAGTENELRWAAPDETASGLARYELHCDDAPDFATPVKVVNVTGETSYTITGLSDGVRYFYRVAAVSGAGLRGPFSLTTHSAQDASPPRTNLETQPPGPNGANGWFTTTARAILNASDNCSGVAHTFYILDGGQLTTGRELTLAGEGEHELVYWSVDEVGNQEHPSSAVIKIDLTPPTAKISVPSVIYLGEEAHFDGSGSVDALEYEWEFGDGTGVSRGASVSHVYNKSGVLRVTLVVRDRAGLTCATFSDVRVLVKGADLPPVARISTLPTVFVGAEVSLDGTGSTDENASALSYDWDFGDGDTASGARVTHVFRKEGTYTIKLRVTDPMGQSDTAYRSIRVYVPGSNLPPLAQISYIGPAYAGEPVIFDASNSSDEEPSSLNFTWDFGDGGGGHGVLATHTYATEGAFIVRLSVRDSGDLSSEATTAVRVYKRGQNLAPFAQFTFRPFSPGAGEEVEFDASLTLDEDIPGLNFTWDFGDGQGAQGKVVSHVFSSPGTYSVRLRVRDSGGLVGEYSDSVRVAGGSPGAAPLPGLIWAAAALVALALVVSIAALARSRRRGASTSPSPPPPGAAGGPMSLIAPPAAPLAPLVVESGLNYLMDSERLEPCCEALTRLVSEGARGLLISPVHPKKIFKGGEPSNVEVYWLSELADQGPSMDPSKMDYELSEKLIEFIKTHRSKAAVMVDGVELLIQTHGFERVLEFVHNINEVASVNEATVLVHVNSRAMREMEYNQLKREFDRW
ncbi:MAG: PKD domain-containing protein [Thermoplasmatota archaeon]